MLCLRQPVHHAPKRRRQRLLAQAAWSDSFSPVNDRVDAPPPPLLLAQRHVVMLVRHGQSTWNAEGRIQGSSDQSVLTEKGRAQAAACGAALADQSFDACFTSPLGRATQTAAAVWGRRPGELVTLPSLREVDLYSLQGVLKADIKSGSVDLRLQEALAAWRAQPAAFQLDGHAPVRELWHRAGLAWRTILEAGADPVCEAPRRVLVVAHNGVNQALLGAAAGWGPALFRSFEQSNAARTARAAAATPFYLSHLLPLQELHFTPGDATVPAPSVHIAGVNITPGKLPLTPPDGRSLVVCDTECDIANGRAVHSYEKPGWAVPRAGATLRERWRWAQEAWGKEAAAMADAAPGSSRLALLDVRLQPFLLCAALGLPPSQLGRFALQPGCASLLLLDKGRVSAATVNSPVGTSLTRNEPPLPARMAAVGWVAESDPDW